MELQKVENDLDRDRCLGILSGYSMGPRTLWLIRTYWVRLQMVARSGGYYGPASKNYRGVTQGYPMSPTIFNVVVDAIIRHWVEVVAPTEAVKEGLNKAVQELSMYFYSDNGLIKLPQKERLQR